MTDFIKLTVPAILVIAGWYVVYRNALKLEFRKDTRKLIEITIGIVESVTEDSRDYYSESNRDHIGYLSARIKADLSLISHYIFMIESCGVKFKGSDALVDFRKCVSGSYFETTDFRKQIDLPGWHSELSVSSARLKMLLDRCYFEWTNALKSKHIVRTYLQKNFKESL
ncbi:hypothetical protein PK98_02965 [Croceibacterium mercuriale]|uniref:DUF4760 domain-containing protein n=1 Tax=Croceibacterium mercuriale TaxID=1572751 RepID=A0A0B2BVI4_9SPHN|nr:hypothetical protein PK98_02965 [Croceibacterium mercuriale]